MIRRPPRSTLFPYTTLFRSWRMAGEFRRADVVHVSLARDLVPMVGALLTLLMGRRSEEHTSELQSPCNLVCRLLLEKKKKLTTPITRGGSPNKWLVQAIIAV